MTDPQPELKTYNGSCHCGAFKFSVQMPEIKTTVQCNCSFCFKRGYEWAYPVANPLIVEKDEGALVGYEFGARSMVHKFCGICGTGIYALKHHGPEDQKLGINLRALKGVDISSLDVEIFDGGSIPPPYESPIYGGPEPSADIENAKIYTGSCHCGAVRLMLKTRGLVGEGSEGITQCGCDVCSRICGVSVYIRRLDVKEEQWEKSAGKAQSLEEWKTRCPVNLKCFEGVEWEEVNKWIWRDVEE